MKRKIILSIIACGASLALCPGLHAQEATTPPSTTGTEAGGGHQWGGHHGGGGLSLERLTTELSLTADEQTQIKPILDTLHTTMMSLHQDTTLAPADKMSKMKDARETAVSQINAILTPDQQAKFAAMQEKSHHHHGGGGADAAASPATSP
jgi:Spy/CpxP family protein refolding chaperone